jgi:hypothetical protein
VTLYFKDPTGSGGPHSHVEADVTNLPADLAGKAPTAHSHAESDVTNLATDLAGKAATGHAHVEADVTGLTGDLAGRATKATQIIAGTGLSGGGDLFANRTLSVVYGTAAGTALQGNDPAVTNARFPTAHSHVEADVTNLATDLSAKPAGIVGRAKRVTNAAVASGTTLATGVVALATAGNIPVVAGRLYRVSAPAVSAFGNGSITGVCVWQGHFTMTTNGTTPTLASTVLFQANREVPNGGAPNVVHMECTYVPATTGTLAVALCYFMAVAGGGTSVQVSGSATAPLEILIEDLGVDPGTVGQSVP